MCGGARERGIGNEGGEGRVTPGGKATKPIQEPKAYCYLDALSD